MILHKGNYGGLFYTSFYIQFREESITNLADPLDVPLPSNLGSITKVVVQLMSQRDGQLLQSLRSIEVLIKGCLHGWYFV